jgi:hypothetical protein
LLTLCANFCTTFLRASCALSFGSIKSIRNFCGAVRLQIFYIKSTKKDLKNLITMLRASYKYCECFGHIRILKEQSDMVKIYDLEVCLYALSFVIIKR